MPNEMLRLGAIGIDSSHLPEFTKRIKALYDAGRTRCKVTALWDAGDHELPDAIKWEQAARDMGVAPVASLDELLGSVDGVMVLAVNGNMHLRLSLPSIQRGIPTYIDKPLTCDLAEARLLLAAARKSNARCYSASSLRFAAEVSSLPRERLGRLHAIDAFGPGELHKSMRGLFFYGVHTIEMVDAIWGPGVKRVSAIHLDDRDLLDMEYHDGRYARLRMERKGCYDFGGTVHGERAVHQFKVDFADVYNRLVKGLVGFFEGGPAPAELRDTVENVAVMVAGNDSVARDGDWVSVEAID